MRVAVYCRVNSKEQQLSALEEQESIVKDFCKKNGADVVSVLREIRSGHAPFTEDFKALLQAVKNRELDGIAVLDLARITREYELFKKFSEDMNRYGGVCISSETGIMKTGKEQQGTAVFLDIEKRLSLLKKSER